MTSVQGSLEQVRARVAAGEAASGRSPGSVALIAVSKTQPVERLAAAIVAGQKAFGENYLQDAIPKMDALAGHTDLRWHFIGALQSNKTRAVAERFDWVHTVDRLKLIERLDAQRPHDATPLNICIQVRGEADDRATGAAAADVPALAAAVDAAERLRLRGLMILPPAEAEGELARPTFVAARSLLAELRASGHELDTLSMGMTGDLEVAIDEGATLVRVGTAIFGSRRTIPKI
jgi:PLP dependent protein